jgi:GNAT superfamily N-acetyltransferase
VKIRIATEDADIAACLPVLSQLRPQLVPSSFVSRIRQLMDTTGFHLAYLDDQGIRAVAGYRISDWLYAGRYLEVEELVTDAASRSQGHGGKLFDWLLAEASRHSCRQLRLLSGTQRLDAHRFYQRKGMKIEAYYFSIAVPEVRAGA